MSDDIPASDADSVTWPIEKVARHGAMAINFNGGTDDQVMKADRILVDAVGKPFAHMYPTDRRAIAVASRDYVEAELQGCRDRYLNHHKEMRRRINRLRRIAEFLQSSPIIQLVPSLAEHVLRPLLEVLDGETVMNGGVACDMLDGEGPCACGSWHVQSSR